MCGEIGLLFVLSCFDSLESKVTLSMKKLKKMQTFSITAVTFTIPFTVTWKLAVAAIQLT